MLFILDVDVMAIKKYQCMEFLGGSKNSQMKKTMVSNTSKVKNDKSLQQKIRADISPIIHLPTLVENATRSINDANNNCGHE